MERISIEEIEGFRIGNAQDLKGGTGATVIICGDGAAAGVDVRGGGPATRETDLLNPLSLCQEVYGVLLSGGSAFGLNAAAGVMRYMEERNIGFDAGAARVPLVPAACLFDLIAGDSRIRPDEEMGYRACLDSESKGFSSGNTGAGTGATIGKYMGVERAMKGGLGAYAVKVGRLKIGALAAVNCLGDVYDADTGEKIGGLLSEDGRSLADTRRLMWESVEEQKNVFTGNTTIGCIITNASLDKSQCCKLASMAHDGYGAAIKPVHTSADGDTIFFLSKGEVEVNQDALGDLGAYVMAKAINDGVRSASSAYGFKALADMDF
ncbi:MAG TPA: P1 family peptidase [Candidatus Copromorpha excrementigallinarum]|uniref:P1 family peptidase n=1 Tax=Candidatus Allocopromorpha excrementigallinarum TaxID=2840742 RepID=A0A9D1HZC7_9FIRM|nr:P1 family peptidase [Candidatus Copromorpha excrementigallinarum]